ncbi:hypothetical protein KQI68_07350 [Peptoniphilus sp. MSJ-1]|uniref:Uncharacterized protein n=1 Tax=Peptoniphilus ovalis TaxID=2841503 RepID=A0ABS6FHK7_9FIRM|nr:hypothetical protein [Peptoniphilus ovalis]MBU5669655.1 hypothetical protein [Peptoniphilus ovalis]
MRDDFNSTVGRNSEEHRTTADVFDAVYSTPSTFDLPLDDIKTYVDDLLIHQIGTKVLVDGNPEFVITSDLKKVYTNIQGHMKDATFLHTTAAKRGSIVEFPNGSLAIVYTIPNDDIVIKSARIVIFNNYIDFFSPRVEYDEDPNSPTYGDVKEFLVITEKRMPVYIEKTGIEYRNQDVGLLHDTVYRLVGSQKDMTAKIGDVVLVEGGYYEISDKDTLTSGICNMQLRTTRDNYDKYVIK